MATDTEVLEMRSATAATEQLQQKVATLQEENERLKGHKLARAKFSPSAVNGGDIPFYNSGKNYLAGYVNPSNNKKKTYHETIQIVRWFYENDPIAGTVINRMADMSVTVIRNRKKTKRNAQEVTPEVLAFYDALAEELRPFLKTVALEFLIHGMAIPQYTTVKLRGDKIAEKLGRKRYTTVEKIWARNPEHIVLKRRPTGMDRQVFYKVPQDEIAFIQNGGTRTDGTKDVEAYQYLVENFPEYVAAIKKGQTIFPLDNVRPIYRKQNSYDEYPIPYLQNSLKALQHKEYLKNMDRSIANRAIEAIRHVKVGDKDFPADDDDITAVEQQVTQNTSTGERIFNLFTNHTVSIEWVFPPLEALLDEAKYSEPNSDIFLGLGFPRILTVGETAKSNAADNKIASLGPKATLDDLREAIIEWLKKLYRELAEINGFDRIPDPYFAPIATTDVTALIQFAIEALNAGAISKDTVAQLYQSDYETEAGQIETEIEMDVPSPADLQKQKEQEFQIKTKEMDQEHSDQQLTKQHEFAREQSKIQSKNDKQEQQNKPAPKKPVAK